MSAWFLRWVKIRCVYQAQKPAGKSHLLRPSTYRFPFSPEVPENQSKRRLDSTANSRRLYACSRTLPSLTSFSKIGHQKTNVFPRQSSVGYFVGPETDHLWTAAQKPEPRNLFARTRGHRRCHYVLRAAIRQRNIRQAPHEHGIQRITDPASL